MNHLKKLAQIEMLEGIFLISIPISGMLNVLVGIGVLTTSMSAGWLLLSASLLIGSVVALNIADSRNRKCLEEIMWEMGFCAKENSEGGVLVFGLNISSSAAGAGLKTDDWMFWLDRNWLGRGINELHGKLPKIYERFLSGERIVFGAVRKLDDYAWVRGGFSK